MPTIDALMGLGDPTDEEQMQALASSLRGRQRSATPFTMSTIKPIAQAATAQREDVQRAAGRSGIMRQQALQRKQQQSQFEQGQQNWQATFDENTRQKALDRQNKIDIQKLRVLIAEKKLTGERKMTQKSVDGVLDISQGYREQQDIFNSFKPEYSGGGMGGRPAANVLSRYAPVLTTESAEEAQRWWSQYQRYHEAIIRHDLFGAALTGTEKENWKEMTPSSNMFPEQIEPMLKKQKKFLEDKVRQYIKTQSASGMPDRVLNSAFGNDYEYLFGQKGTASDFTQTYQPTAQAGASPNEILETAAEAEISGYEDKSEEELRQQLIDRGLLQ